MQQVRPRWQPMHSQQQVRPPGMQGMPGAGQVPRARGIRQVPPRGVPGQQQPGGAGGPSQRVGAMGQAQVRGPGAMQGQGQRPTYKFQQNVRNQPAQGHPGAVPMQPQEQVPQTIQIPVSGIASILKAMIGTVLSSCIGVFSNTNRHECCECCNQYLQFQLYHYYYYYYYL